MSKENIYYKKLSKALTELTEDDVVITELYRQGGDKLSNGMYELIKYEPEYFTDEKMDKVFSDLIRYDFSCEQNFPDIYRSTVNDLKQYLITHNVSVDNKDIAAKSYGIVHQMIDEYHSLPLGDDYNYVERAKHQVLFTIDNPDFKDNLIFKTIDELNDFDEMLKSERHNDRSDRVFSEFSSIEQPEGAFDLQKN